MGFLQFSSMEDGRAEVFCPWNSLEWYDSPKIQISSGWEWQRSLFEGFLLYFRRCFSALFCASEENEAFWWMATATHHRHQKSTGFDLSIFCPLRKQWYIITRKRASHHRRCISSAVGCIVLSQWCYTIPAELMICKTSFWWYTRLRRDLCKSSNSYAKTVKISFL